MVDVTDAGAPKRGMSASRMRSFICKDCQREVEGLEAQVAELEANDAPRAQLNKKKNELRVRREKAIYNENWAHNLVERGGSRSDRCKDHRQEHRANIQGLAVAYIDLKTVGEVADRNNPTGPLGGLGPLPTAHEVVEGTAYDLQEVRVGMTDGHVAEMVEKLREKQVLILKAGTGTGKSTFAPYRLMDPPTSTLEGVPAEAPFAKLTDLGPIIVTEPRVQAAVGVASFVGGVMSGAGGVGPGYPVGYQVSGDRNHDEACELVYVTDGTMINWLREGRLSRIGTVIVDEAHERSTNIDFIMGYLKRELPRYPHLRVIVTSATFNTDFYLEYFGGPTKANVMDVPPEKTFGYGMPLFPNLDSPEEGEEDIVEQWADAALPLTKQSPRDEKDFIRTHWKTQFAEPLHFPDDLTRKAEDPFTEDVWDTTQHLLRLRYKGSIPIAEWQDRMPAEMAKFVIQLAQGLDDAGIFGDILGFLPTRRTIEPVCDEIEKALGRTYKDQVFPLISSLPKDRQKKALTKRRKGDARKIVISTNLAETSLTVEGVRFVVDSGIIAQSEWDPDLAKGTIPTKPHSQAGIKQRWGRVGRKAPGWVFPLYTKGQFLQLAEDTPPGSTRDNLEALVMTAKVGGIDDVLGFDWPAAFQPTTVELDENASAARRVFVKELGRADRALRAGGAVDNDGHPTSFGKELTRFQGLGSTASAIAIMYADRLACVPEVATAIALLEDTRLIGQRGLLLDDFDWPDDWRLEAAERHRGLASLCDDDAELALVIMAAWERADPACPPWDDSPRRRDWARKWWVNHSVLLEAAAKRQDVLAALSPAMKEDVRRFVEPALISRARGVLTRAMAANIFTKSAEGEYQPSSTLSTDREVAVETLPTPTQLETPVGAASRRFAIEEDELVRPGAEHLVAMRRRESKFDNRISSLVIAQEWAMTRLDERQPSSAVDAVRMLTLAAKYAPADAAKSAALRYLENWPVGQRFRLNLTTVGNAIRATAIEDPIPPFPRPRTREERGVGPSNKGAGRARARSRLAFGEEDRNGTTDDLTTEIRLEPRRGYNDEGSERAALLKADRETGVLQGCGQCFPCRDDRPEDCERQSVPAQPGRREDLVASWRSKVESDGDLARPRVVVDSEASFDSEGWYEVTGYVRDDDGYIVKLRPDWRRGRATNAGQHPDLKAGDPIEVRVGRLLRHHGGSLRAFDRTDGEGRFILAEAWGRYDSEQVRRREIAVSLHRGSTGLLDGLTPEAVVTATVVPARAEGTLTITLLELLHQHWSKAQPGRGASNEVLDRSRRNQRTEKVYTAVVESAPNANGYATARLLHQDSQLGVVHRFDFKVSPKQDKNAVDTEASEDEASIVDVPQFNPGDPIMIKLKSDRAQLDVSGLSIDRLRAIEAKQAGQITIDGLPTMDELFPKRASTSRGKPQARTGGAHQTDSEIENSIDEDELDEEDLAPSGTFVRAKTEKPLSRSAAVDLVDLNDEPDWPNEVWSFWARTHHLQVDDRAPILPGTLTEVFEVAAKVRIETTTPEAQQRARWASFIVEHPVHSTVDCVVKSLSGGGVSVELADGIEGFIPKGELSWASRVTHPDQVVAVGDRLFALLQSVSEPPAKPQLSVKALKSDPFEGFKESFPPGSRVSGVIDGRIEHFVFVDLGGDVDGSIHISELDHLHVSTAETFSEIGATIEVEVLSFDDEARKVGLSRKKTLPHPYIVYKAQHAVGDKVEVTVERVSKTHVNVRHSNGAPGVIHVSNLRWDRVDDASELYQPGDQATVQITSFDDNRRQLELSIKALMPEPYTEFKSQNKVGDTVQAIVERANAQHVNLRHPNGAQGHIHASQISWDHVADASALYKSGDRVSARITRFNDEKRTIELSVKALLPEPYPEFKATTAIGTILSGVVSGFNDSFAYVRLPGGIDGSIHVSQLAMRRVEKPSELLTKGQQVTAAVIGFDDQRRKVQLSLRQAPPPATLYSQVAAPPTPQRSTPTRAPVLQADSPRVPRTVTAEGDTVADAVAKACRQLNLPTSAVTYEVLDQGTPRRIFRAAQPARVRVTTR